MGHDCEVLGNDPGIRLVVAFENVSNDKSSFLSQDRIHWERSNSESKLLEALCMSVICKANSPKDRRLQHGLHVMSVGASR